MELNPVLAQLWLKHTLDYEEIKEEETIVRELDSLDSKYIGESISQGKSFIFHGWGILVSIQHKYIYEGYFNKGEFDREGILVWEDLTVYKGVYTLDKKGKWYFGESGNSYEGECFNGRPHGEGWLKLVDKPPWKVFYEHGR